MDDRVSRWLQENWYGPHFGHSNMLLACTLARHYNRPATLEAIGYPKRWEPARVKQVVARLARQGPVFNAAYIISGTLGSPKELQVVDKVVNALYRVPPQVNPDSMEQTAEALLTYNGFGSFIAGQVVADLRWARPGRWLDRLTWAPAGPGSKRGLNRVYGRDPDTAVSPTRWEDEFADLVGQLRTELPGGLVDRLEGIDYQNCLCEFGKYERARLGEGRPKQIYRADQALLPMRRAAR
jgi:hypothetical protein